MDPNETIIEIADHRRRLQLIKDAVLDAQDLCARARSTVWASEELLQQVDNLHQSNMGLCCTRTNIEYSSGSLAMFTAIRVLADVHQARPH
jgi:hypothetical protein